MPRTRSLAWSELKIGVISIIAVTLTGVLIFAVTGARGFFWDRYPLKTRFTAVPNLASGTPVRIAGVEVGGVTAVELNGEQVDISFEVRKSYRHLITNRSTAKLGAISALGEAALDITPSSQGEPIADWGYVPAGPPSAAITDMADMASGTIDELTKTLRGLNAGKGTAGQLLTDAQLYTELNRFVSTATALTQDVQHGRGSVGRLMHDPAAAKALEASLANMEAMTRQLRDGKGSVGQLLHDDRFAASLTSATGNLDALLAKLNSTDGTAGKLMNDPALYDRLTQMTTRLDELTAALNSGQGTAGQLLKDRQLYDNMNAAVGDVRALVADIRKDPRRFLNVKVSVF